MEHRRRICGCTGGPECHGQCWRRGGCACHALLYLLGHEPSDAEITTAFAEQRSVRCFEGLVGAQLGLLTDRELLRELRQVSLAVFGPETRTLLVRELVSRIVREGEEGARRPPTPPGRRA